MTGWGRYEGSIARYEGGGSVFSCVMPHRFRILPGREIWHCSAAGEGYADRSGRQDVVKPSAVRQAEIPDREVLAGLVERVTFHNPEKGFCVLPTRARGHRDLVTVVGRAAMVAPGAWITALGRVGERP